MLRKRDKDWHICPSLTMSNRIIEAARESPILPLMQRCVRPQIPQPASRQLIYQATLRVRLTLCGCDKANQRVPVRLGLLVAENPIPGANGTARAQASPCSVVASTQPALADGGLHQRGSILGAGFCHDVLAVRFHGARAGEELFGNLRPWSGRRPPAAGFPARAP